MVKVAILHEGNSQKNYDNELLKLLIENLGLDVKQVKFFGMGSKSNFFKADNSNYKELQTDLELENISKVLFFVDADDVKNDNLYGGYENTEKALQEIIQKLSLKKRADYFITCDPKNKSGYLESFILSTIPKEQKECIDTFLECSQFKSKENDKVILNKIYKMAYPNTPYDLKHENFSELKQKLSDLFEEKL